MEITIYVFLIWCTAIIIGSLDLVIFLGSKTLSSRAFAHSILWVTIWVAAVGFFVASREYQAAMFYSRLTYYLGSVIAASFLYFFITYPEDKKPNAFLTWSLIIFQCVYAYIFLFTNNIISGLFPINAAHPWGWNFGYLSFIFELSFFGFFGLGIFILYRKLKTHIDHNIKTNLKYMLWAIIIGSVPPSLTCIILPRLGYFGLNWLGPVTEIIWIPIISYSIIKYRQMNVRAVVTEVLGIGMAMIFFLNIFIETPLGEWGRTGTFIIFLVLGYFLIRGVLKEAKLRDQLKTLNSTLSEKVSEQTREIREAYEIEKKARRDLEKLNDGKNQFIMITQHHLRTPVTSIDWELESMLSGAYGPITPTLQTAVANARTSARRLTRIIDDFLNIAALKAGGSILNLSEQSLKPAIVDILDELKLDIARMRLEVSYPSDDALWPEISIDFAKMREIILVVVENAVRYNREGGKILISTGINANAGDHNGDFELIIENTGIGITPGEKSKIGSALFYRGQYARKAYPVGMGIGLSVVKAIVAAHHGTFSIESQGLGKGARVIITLPLIKNTAR